MTDREALVKIKDILEKAWADVPFDIWGVATVLATAADDVEQVLESVGLNPKEETNYDR